MKKGDRFFIIAYTTNTRVIEVEIINIEVINGVQFVHFENVNHTVDKWFKPIDEVAEWLFNTREEAEVKLKC
jgi:hypothetical protein